MPEIHSAISHGNNIYVTFSDGTSTTLLRGHGDMWVGSLNSGTLNGQDTVNAPGGSISGVVTAEMIEAAVKSVGGSTSGMVATSAEIAASFNKALESIEPNPANTAKRIACLIGECAAESAWFRSLTEYGGSSAEYAPYYGRGFIQLTWKDNYLRFGRWCLSKGLVTDATYFVDNPDVVATMQWAAYTAIFYFETKWDGKSLWQISDSSSSPWSRVSRAINRGNPDATSPAYSESERATAINAVLAVASEPVVTPPDNTATMQAMLDKMRSLKGTLSYTQNQTGRINVPGGSADCSGLCWWLYKTYYKIDIGLWTGAQYTKGKLVQYQPNTSAGVNESLMRPGDLVFYDWGGYTSTYDHVSMYMGNNTTMGHGGPNAGPKVYTNMQARVGYASRVMVRRYVNS